MLLLLFLFLLQDDPAGLIEKLRSENIEVREAATKRLKELGRAIRPQLEKAEKDPDVEVSSRVAYLIRLIDLPQLITSNLQKVIPDAVERLAKGGDEDWTSVFLEATGRERDGSRKLQAITREDVASLVTRAFRGSTTVSDKTRVITAAAEWRFENALPDIERLLGDSEPAVRQTALVRGAELAGVAWADKLADGLKDDYKPIRWTAASLLGQHGARTKVKAVEDCLKDEHEVGVLQALDALGRLGDRTVASAVAPLLETKFRGHAALCLARLGLKEFIPRIQDALAATGGQRETLQALALLDARESAPHVLPFLSDRSGEMRGIALWTLHRWRVPEAMVKLPQMLKDEDPRARMYAVQVAGQGSDKNLATLLLPFLKDPVLRSTAASSLESLNATEYCPDIAATVKDTDPYSRWNVVLAWGKLGSRASEKDRAEATQVLTSMENDPSEETRFAASISLIRLGAKDLSGQREVIRRLNSVAFQYRWIMVPETTMALLQTHEKATFEKLSREIPLKRSIESIEDLAAVLEEGGLKLNRQDVIIQGRKSAGGVVKPIDLISSFIGPWPSIILEKDTVKVTSTEPALKYWSKRLEGK